MKRKHQLKSMLALILAFVMCISGMPTTVTAAETGGEPISYGQVTSVDDITSGGSFVLAVQTDSGYLALDKAVSGKTEGVGITVDNGVVTSADAPTWTIASCGSGVSLHDGTNYLSYSSSTNFSTASEPYEWTVTATESGGFQFVAAATSATSTVRAIFYRAGDIKKFAPYAASNVPPEYNSNILVFKAGAASGGGTGAQTCASVKASVTPGAVDAGTNVELSCTTEGATIYYNTDNSDTYLTYSSAINITEATTIRAYASKEGMNNSNVATFAYTIKVPATLMTIAEARTAAVNTENIMVQGTVVFIDSKNVYVQDSTGAINLYFSSVPSGLNVGDVIKATGKRASYKGLEQLSGVAAYDKVDTVSAPSTTVTIADINADASIGALECTRVYIENAIVGEKTGDNTPLIQGGSTINLYKAPEVAGMEAGATVSLYAVVSDFNGYQLRVTSASDVTVQADGVSTIAEAKAAATGTENITVRGTVVLIDGTNIYVQDSTGGIDLYFSTAPTDLQIGDIIKATGKRASYKGLEELSGVTSYEKVISVNAPSKKVTIADIIADQETGVLESTRVYIENAVIGAVNTSGNTTLTQGDATINIYKIPELANITEGATVSLYAVISDFNGYQLRVASASDVTKISDGRPDEPTPDDGTVKNGNYVIWASAYNKALSSEYNGFYNKGVDVSLTGTQLSGYTNAEIWTVTHNADDTYYISYGGQNLAMAANFSSLTLGEVNDKWVLEDAGDGKYYVKNVGRNNYIEWYSKNSNWSGYSTISSGSEGMFALTFTPAVKGYNTDSSVVETIAQWGGGGPYDATANASVVNGDKYVAGDQKDAKASFSVVANGVAGQPYQQQSSGTGGYNYYMGGTNIGKAAGDYMQFAVDTAGYGAMSLSFRLRATNAGPGSFQLQYSTDNGATFENFTTGEYSYAYTKYINNEPSEVTGSGAITDGVAATSKAAAQYVSFKFDVPQGAENAEKLLIRLVAGTTRADGGTGAVSGNIRIDSVVLSGSPIVDDSITGYVTVTPDGKEEDQAAGTELTMASATAGAVISYRFVDADGNGEWKTYEEAAKPALPATLPAILEVKASAAGKADSITRIFTYAAGSVSPVKMTPNGGGVYISGTSATVILSCETQGATIYYQLNGEGDFVPYTEPLVLEKGFGKTVIKAYAVKEGFKDSAVVTRTFTERSSETYNIYFGQLHSHTSYSDGAGSAEDAYQHASQVKNLDFLAVTDHSNSFDNADSASISDGSMSTEWVEGHALAEQYTTEDFVGLFGYEMTWSNGLGHMNTFNTPGFQSRTQTEYKTYATALQNYYATLKTETDSISQFNHPGTTFGDFSDFAYYDEEIDELITIIEVGNGEGAIGSSGYFPSYEYYTRALDKGWHVAPTNNQDNHKGLWGDANTGRSVVLADSLSEDDIYDAMRNYRVYATEDNDLSIMYTLDDNIMGTIMDKSDVGDNVTLKVALTDPTDSSIGKVEVIVNGGLSIASKNVATASEAVNFTVPSDYSYYYIRVTEADGDIAVTAPVWVGEVEAVGISGLSTSSSLPVQNQALDLTLDLYNNESKDLEIESIEFTVGDKVIHTADLTNLTKVDKKSTASYTFSYTHDGLGQTNINATVKANLNGVEKVYKEVLKLTYVSPSMVSKVIVDGTHYNDYVTGYYGGNMGNFTAISADKMVEVTVVKDEITEEMLSDCGLLVISAPARKAGTATAGEYTASSFEDSFIEMVKKYVENGGNVVICGLADYQDKGASSADGHASAQLNKLLAAIGSTMRINDDEVYDPVNNGGQFYRLYPSVFNKDSRWTSGIVTSDDNPDNYQTYSQYSGCSVNPGNGTWLVKGFDTTYSVDSDKDGEGNTSEVETDDSYGYNIVVPRGEVVFLASEDTAYGGTVFAAGGVFLSDFEVKAELDNIWDLPYANRTIAENILDSIQKQLPLSTIAQMRAGNYNDVFRIQGYATAGRIEGNAFFDAMYIQDETGGITVFPIAEEGLKIGTKMEIVGYLDQYQGDKEIQIMSYKILDEEPYVYAPQKMTAAEAMDYDKSGGKLVRIEGKVVDVLYDAAGTGVSQFWIDDGSGTIGNVFIDGYILSATTGKNELASIVKVGETISAVGLVYAHPEGTSDIPVTCLRVRNCDEITAVTQTGGDNGGNTDSGNNDSGSTNIWGSTVVNPEPDTAKPESSGNRNKRNNKKNAYADNGLPKKNKIVVEKEGDWKAVADSFEQIADGGKIYLNLGDDTMLSGDVISSMRGKDIYLVITLENGVVWSIYGKDIVEEKIANMDLEVVLHTHEIPEDLVSSVAGEGSSMQMSLKHDGTFGFKAYLTVNVGEEYADSQAKLYYYNEESGELELQYTGTVAADGSLEMLFSHASDYVIVLEQVALADADAETEEAVDSAETTEIEEQEASMNIDPIVVILLLVVAAVVAVLFIRKKKSVK